VGSDCVSPLLAVWLPVSHSDTVALDSRSHWICFVGGELGSLPLSSLLVCFVDTLRVCFTVSSLLLTRCECSPSQEAAQRGCCTMRCADKCTCVVWMCCQGHGEEHEVNGRLSMMSIDGDVVMDALRIARVRQMIEMMTSSRQGGRLVD
jgi:hypothetical protein